jgi:hypothetical protein
MKPNEKYKPRSGRFWAHVKYLSEQIGYSYRGSKGPRGSLRHYDLDTAVNVLHSAFHDERRIKIDEEFVAEVIGYMNFRTDAITKFVEPVLMTRDQAREEYLKLKDAYRPQLAASFNKQKGEKRHEAYLSSMVQIIAEAEFGHDGFVNDARRLATIWRDGDLYHTFSRRFDGAYPDVRDPLAVWEIKEYYGTTTFGSRVADGVYETLLDGYEIENARQDMGVDVKHYLFIDDRFTWWDCGRSYLCRMVDMLHSGHVDEIFFGRDVVTNWPETARELAALKSS